MPWAAGLGMGALAIILVLLLAPGLLSLAAKPAPTPLSDAQVQWCHANALAVYREIQILFGPGDAHGDQRTQLIGQLAYTYFLGWVADPPDTSQMREWAQDMATFEGTYPDDFARACRASWDLGH